MAPWLYVGKRVEYTAAIYTVATYLLFGFLLASRAPIEIRWIIWLLGVTFAVPFGVAFLLLGRWVRRRALGSPIPAAGMAGVALQRTRLLIYVVMAIVTIPSARIQAKAIPATLARVLLWNFGILAVLIAIIELAEWRKRRMHRA